MTTDDRFSKVAKDPRFSKIKKKESKVKIDARFKKMFEEKSFQTTSKFDKYGRKVSALADSQKINMKRFYSLSEDEDNEEKIPEIGESDQSFSEYSTDDDQTFDIPDGEEIHMEHPLALNDLTYGNRTFRFAVTNLDWDFIKAADLLKLFDSFKPKGGIVKSSKIYTSEFGKERLNIENSSGPIFSSVSKNNDQNEHENEEMNERLSQIALKKYKLERLRYYFAVIECDSVSTASWIYDCCDGAEFEKSSNFLDLRFIPDDVEFSDQDIRESSFEIDDKSYKPKEFSSSTLQNTTQKLVWDEDDVDRIKITKRSLSKAEIDEADYNAFIASSESEAENETESIQKYKLIMNDIDKDKITSNPYVKDQVDDEEMEITFTAGLSDVAVDLLDRMKEKEKKKTETPFEAKIRKEKEKRKARRKELRNNYEISEDEDSNQPTSVKSLELLTSNNLEKDLSSFKVNTDDTRFSAIYDSSLYAIDPTHPSYKNTEGNKEILKKKRTKRSQD